MAASAYRVQPIVASIGQAMGTAAAVIIKNNTSPMNIDLKPIQEKLLPKKK